MGPPVEPGGAARDALGGRARDEFEARRYYWTGARAAEHDPVNP
jgi:hypothetical protein